ncbi:alkaline phosphatase D family protein [Algoriphagus sp. C2-6-M1]|uniref:alkaline phosphatase D family protein n=1 Tax=Algoriphagus persicinus TaxID=3108754 RepID=UPI002B3A87F7|nr:alkaline phosphatase D family protein [Algoriphagus sp. C2-6-M1]MEB2780466.1 alkaline phosphatase D family protein [Algoriphagus sp. C2-6-M1]
MDSSPHNKQTQLFISSEKIDRRTFLQKTALTLSGASLIGAIPFYTKAGELSDYPFTLGVASGEPLPDGIVLWTRLAPKPLEGGGLTDQEIEVSWEIASDPGFSDIVQHGKELATKDFAHSIHVEVSDLSPSSYYYYRFKTGDYVSQTGKTKTAPAFGTDLAELRFAIASCQNYASGLYTAYDHMVKEDLDVVFFLGDYIYEKGSGANALRKHLPEKEIMTLEDYRIRYGQYKSDPSLMAAHAAFPWIVVPDDHEVKNNWGGDGPPYDDNASFLHRRAVAFQAYYEHMPLRKASIPKGIAMNIYRKFRFGNLAEFSMLDTRQFRTDFACNGSWEANCAARYDPSRTMLGEVQENWLTDNLSQSSCTWNILGQQVRMAQVGRKMDGAIKYAADSWDGYAATRNRLMNSIKENQVKNLVVLTGDSHKNWVNELRLNPDDPQSEVMGTEFMGTSISSAGDGNEFSEVGLELMEVNPDIKFYNEQRGYVVLVAKPDELKADFKVMPFVTRPDAPIYTIASFTIENGIAGLNKASHYEELAR